MRVFRPADLGVGIRIAGTGAYLPARVVTNADLAALGAPLGDEEIVRLTGIRARHFAAADEATSDLAAHACRRALATAGLAPGGVDRLVVATVSPDHPSPSAACFAHHALGLGAAPAHDVTASCSGFLYALDVAARAVATGDRAALACAADIRSRFVDFGDRATCALFGDGAGAAVLTPGPVGQGLVAIGLSADGAGARAVYVPAGGSREPATADTVAARRHTIRMTEGPQVYLAAVEGILGTAEALLGALGMTFADVDLVVPHQPNRRILDRIARLARLPEEKLFVNVDRTGNVSGASVAIALDEALRGGRAPAGARVLLLAAGAGYTAGAALLVVDEGLAAATARDAAPGAAAAKPAPG
jgi:3-oxoacyl-[acyl-carrier-protein] synthase-3